MVDRDFSKCDVCGLDIGPDKLHIVMQHGVNSYSVRSIYAHRRHRYVEVEIGNPISALAIARVINERSDREIENLADAFRRGELKVGWE